MDPLVFAGPVITPNPIVIIPLFLTNAQLALVVVAFIVSTDSNLDAARYCWANSFVYRILVARCLLAFYRSLNR